MTVESPLGNQSRTWRMVWSGYRLLDFGCQTPDSTRGSWSPCLAGVLETDGCLDNEQGHYDWLTVCLKREAKGSTGAEQCKRELLTI